VIPFRISRLRTIPGTMGQKTHVEYHLYLNVYDEGEGTKQDTSDLQ
jgi:hypothetical protein